MIVRKIFSVETGHIVRNCSSDRCKYTHHGHSAKIELFFESEYLDNAGMVMDFGLMKNDIKAFIDMMDHCYLFCSAEDEEFKNFHRLYNNRWIELPFIPSAEMLSIFIFRFVEQIIRFTIFTNGERGVRLKSVRYHETDTCYAECDKADAMRYTPERFAELLDGITFSEELSAGMPENLVKKLGGTAVPNPETEQQIRP